MFISPILDIFEEFSVLHSLAFPGFSGARYKILTAMNVLDPQQKPIFDSFEEMMSHLAVRLSEADCVRIRQAFHFAAEAHAGQTRKTGEPYIMHPVAVARIVAEEFLMDANSIVAAFLHDVVEDTSRTVDDIRQHFGDDVAFLVKVVTKPKGKPEPGMEQNKQENNFRQLLDSLQHDIRAVLVKLADRLHNMRTLGSMQPVKQMKIGGETDYFYAPFANRLGLHSLRRELENLSFKFRCGDRYERLSRLIEADKADNAERLDAFTRRIKDILAQHGLEVRTEIRFRGPYSIDRSMRKTGRDFAHVEYRHVVRVIYDRQRLAPSDKNRNDKAICLRVYGALTNVFQEMTGSILNFIDHPKENGYQSFHFRLLDEAGRWEEIHVSSEEMVRHTKLGLLLDRISDRQGERAQGEGANRFLARSDRQWMNKFCDLLRQIAASESDLQFMEGVSTSLYSEDISVYDECGNSYKLPQQATALDFAFERGMGEHAQYAVIDGRLAPMTTELTHGCCVEIHTHPDATPFPHWADAVKTYKAKDYLTAYIRRSHCAEPQRCGLCAPLPGQEVIGILEQDGSTTLHRRDCPRAISLSARRGDAIVDVEFPATDRVYLVKTHIRAIDRYRLIHDIVDCVATGLGLSINYLNTEIADNIAECTIHYYVHSADELRAAVRYLGSIPGVDEVYKI